MNPIVVIFGANGVLGSYLTRYFHRHGREVVAIDLGREGWMGDGMFLEWDGKSLGPWALTLEGAEAVIILDNRQTLGEHGRTDFTAARVRNELVGQAMRNCQTPPKCWLSESSADWYETTENQPQNDWLGLPGMSEYHLWTQRSEDAFFAVLVPGAVRKIAIRLGSVLAGEQGTLFASSRRWAGFGCSGLIGNGGQRVSWIHMDDFLRAVELIIEDPYLDGAVTVTAPECPVQCEWMRFFRETFGFPVNYRLPRWFGNFLRGMGICREFNVRSRWVEPLRLKDAGFRWRWGHAREAIEDIAHRPGLNRFFPQTTKRSTGVPAWVRSPARI